MMPTSSPRTRLGSAAVQTLAQGGARPTFATRVLEGVRRAGELPGAALRSSAIQLMGSGAKSVPFPKLLAAVGNVLKAAQPAKLQIATKKVPLAAIEEAWHLPGKPRAVVTIP